MRETADPKHVDVSDVDVLAPNFKQRLSGVTSTIIQLVPKQRDLGVKIAVCGAGLPAHLPHIRLRDFWKFSRVPKDQKLRVWHARRNIEMLPGIIMRDVFRMPFKLLFTSASQRNHKKYTKWLIGKMDFVIATSQKTSLYLKVPNQVIMHGIDLERFKPVIDKTAHKASLGLDKNQKIIGCFGRVRHQKGTDLFVDTMIKVLPDFPAWSAIIAGRATAEHKAFEKQLMAKVKSAGLENRILFVGEHKDIERWYQALDLFIAPQRWEGFGLTPLEAGACAVPTIAADVGAFSELIIDHKTGQIIPRDDLNAMIKATTDYLSNKDQWKAYSSDAREHITQNFALEGEAKKLNSVYQNLLNGEKMA